MNYLWESVLSVSTKGMDTHTIRYAMAKRFSGYMELSNPCLNQVDISDLPVVEVNLYYRFYHIFKDLLSPSEKEFPGLIDSLVNIFVHMLAQNDVLSGMNKKEYYKELLFKDFKNGVFGMKAYECMMLFERNEREIILSGLLRQYDTGSSIDIFKNMVEDLIDDSIVYQSNDNFFEILVFVGQKEDERIRKKMLLLIDLFVDLPFHVELYYQYHFGIIGVGCTMELDEMTLC